MYPTETLGDFRRASPDVDKRYPPGSLWSSVCINVLPHLMHRRSSGCSPINTARSEATRYITVSYGNVMESTFISSQKDVRERTFSSSRYSSGSFEARFVTCATSRKHARTVAISAHFPTNDVLAITWDKWSRKPPVNRGRPPYYTLCLQE